MPWPTENIVVACLAAIGIFTTTFSIIEPRPLLAISHQAHTVVDPVWDSFKFRMNTPLGLSDRGDFALHDNTTFRHLSPLHGTNPTCTYITATTSKNPVSSASVNSTMELPLISVENGTNLATLPASKAPQKSPVDYRKFVSEYLLHASDWISSDQITLFIVLCLSALCLVLFVPIAVPRSLPDMPRVKVTRRAAKGPCRYRWSLLATLTDSLSEAPAFSKTLHESAQTLDNSFYGCYVKRSRFNRKQRALDQKKRVSMRRSMTSLPQNGT